ncbi:MAG TPA: universal stress protein [Verrucomicrobiae bacterium]|nr:universal stress protein [Verrucomicrobiae bacterium]
MRFHRILFPTDFSPAAARMAPYAREIAQRFHAQVTVLHAFDLVPAYAVPPHFAGEWEIGSLAAPLTPQFQERRQELELRLQEFANREFAGLAHSARVEDGDAAAVIEWIAQEEASDVIIMPTTGHGRFRRMLLGSITTKVLHDLACPVLTSAHQLHSATGAAGYGSILCAIEINREAYDILDAASFLAGAYGARLCVVHVESVPAVPNGEQGATESIRHAFQEALNGCAAAGVEASVRVLDASVPEGIRRTAIEEGADLIVVGRGHQRGTFSRLWSPLYRIICESPCSVLSV